MTEQAGRPSIAAMRAAEQNRVEAMLKRDRDYHAAEIARAAAEIDLENGKTVSIVDAVIEPTPEWFQHGDSTTFIPRLEQGTVKTVRAHRRMKAMIVLRLHGAGKVTDDQLSACVWYRDQWELGGLTGRVKTSYLSLTGNVGGGTGGMGQAPMPLHEAELIARDYFRLARAAIAPNLLKMFDAVVLENLPLRRAERFVRCRNGQVLSRFRAACEDLIAYMDRAQIDLHSTTQFSAD